MIHPNYRAHVTAVMKSYLLQHLDVDQVLDKVAEKFGVTKRLAAEMVPKDSSTESRAVLGLFIAAEITSGLQRGLTSEQAVRSGLQRFDVQAPKATFENWVRMFEKERNRLAGLRPGEVDNGVGGTMEIVDSSGNPIAIGKKSA